MAGKLFSPWALNEVLCYANVVICYSARFFPFFVHSRNMSPTNAGPLPISSPDTNVSDSLWSPVMTALNVISECEETAPPNDKKQKQKNKTKQKRGFQASIEHSLFKWNSCCVCCNTMCSGYHTVSVKSESWWLLMACLICAESST